MVEDTYNRNLESVYAKNELFFSPVSAIPARVYLPGPPINCIEERPEEAAIGSGGA
jgi:hypothetical protein